MFYAFDRIASDPPNPEGIRATRFPALPEDERYLVLVNDWFLIYSLHPPASPEYEGVLRIIEFDELRSRLPRS